ncbi:M12 family metallo-peptidase [Povalibacter sp.]|uniref:M12 family metallo-peptidase n=1 Tax=Povalibacter sp. TaxID=1962978 RepID=UPI002F3E477F
MQVRWGSLTGWLPEIVVCAALALPMTVAAATSDVGALRILAHEPFRPLSASHPPGAAKSSTGSLRTLKFDAYGRRFSLLLESNQRLMASSSNQGDGPALTLYQGVIENVPGSWVRMSAKAQDIRGALWDGRELYLVDSSAALGDAGDETGDTIIFRLADTEVPAGGTFCSDAPSPSAQSGKAAYSQMLQELKTSPVIMQATGAALRLELSALADDLFRARYASDRQARDEILSRINIVDGIYTSQLQLEIQIPTFNINDSVASQLSSTTTPGTLVDELGLLRQRTPVLRARGLTHLFTGRDLDGQTVGIAYNASLCGSRYGVGLTQTSRAVTIDALVTAHEIGHNFGAPHDGEKECAATPQGQHLMSPSVSTNATTFSDCSLEQIRPRIQAASCLLPLTAPDLQIPLDLGTSSHAVGAPFNWELTVNNIGGSVAYDSDVTLWLPPVVVIEEVFVAGGTCTSRAGRIQCGMGNIPASGSRTVQMTLRSDVLGSNSISARVYAAADRQTDNNVGDGTLSIEQEADVSVSAQAPVSVVAGTTVTASFTITNESAIDVESVVVAANVSGGVTITAGEIAGGVCSVAGASAQCTLPSLAAGQSATGTLTLHALTTGAANLKTAVSGSYVDPGAGNDAAEQSISVVPSPDARPARKGGGGGSGSWLLIAALGTLAGLRHRRTPLSPG